MTLRNRKPKRSLNSFMIYRIVIQNYLKANKLSYSCPIVSKLSSKLWKNEREDIKNVYKRLAKRRKPREKILGQLTVTKELRKALFLPEPQWIFLQTPNQFTTIKFDHLL
ncbi:hypothetical protein C2G38_2053999 [Gigaspora rosea]|uniref:HMG box domain-containing protein n=1 Tax=Gigaspora rosea TaxID=44941 RepID=A0A397W6N3_9GLOM|nr:hypothetical protein C2G38_2053999 [Gigaspora rosea]